MSRELFLKRVREAARAGSAYRVHVPHLSDRVGYCGAGDDLPGRLVAEVESVGGQGRLVDDWTAAQAAVEALLDQYAPSSALCWKHPVLERLGLATLLAARGIAQLDYDSLSPLDPVEQRDRMLAAQIGISSATYAVAETGTLAMASRPGAERVASLLPPVHIAIVSADQILPDLFDLFDKVQPPSEKGDVSILPERNKECSPQNGPFPIFAAMPSNWTLITGPSKTGDLELKLTTGVHGPGKWHVIVIRTLSKSSGRKS